MHDDRIGEQRRIGQEDAALRRLQCRVAEIDLLYDAFQPGNRNVRAAPKRAVKEDHRPGKEIGQRVLQRKAQGKARKPQTGDECRHVQPEGAESDDDAKYPDREAGNLCRERQQCFAVRTATNRDAANQRSHDPAGDVERQQDEQREQEADTKCFDLVPKRGIESGHVPEDRRSRADG